MEVKRRKTLKSVISDVSAVDDLEDKSEDDATIENEPQSISVTELQNNSVHQDHELVNIGKNCPYLSTIDRHRLDFDFEKICSVSLTTINIYACLVCGKYFQGRGPKTMAYFHSLEADHHVYIHLLNRKIYCLPDGYEVLDNSLEDIKYLINPIYSSKEIKELDSQHVEAYDLNRQIYSRGFMGVNNIKANDYLNVVLQSLSHIPPLRNFFLVESNYLLKDSVAPSQIVRAFGEFTRKIWNSRAFKSHVSPHEIIQAVSSASNKKFTSSEQRDPFELLLFFLHHLHTDLIEKKINLVHQLFQGIIGIHTEILKKKRLEVSEGDHREISEPAPDSLTDIQNRTSPFLTLSFELPAQPLFKSEQERHSIPQISLLDLLSKYDGKTVHELRDTRKRYLIDSLPPYLIFHYKRFAKNFFVDERNPTIINFPLDDLSLSKCVDNNKVQRYGVDYHLLVNICFDVKLKSYLVHLRDKATDKWYEIQDLYVKQVQSDTVFLAESYIQIWETKKKR